MNTRLRKPLTVAGGLMCSLAAMSALAAGAWSAQTLIDRITVRVDQTIVVTNPSGTWVNPNACDNNTRIILLPPGSQGAGLAYKEVYASLLGAHLTNREVAVFINGCASLASGGQTFPVINQVAVY